MRRTRDESRRRDAQECAEDVPRLAADAVAERSPRAPSSRTGSTARSACSGRSASPPPACCRARSRRSSCRRRAQRASLSARHRASDRLLHRRSGDGTRPDAVSASRARRCCAPRGMLMRGEVLVPSSVWAGPTDDRRRPRRLRRGRARSSHATFIGRRLCADRRLRYPLRSQHIRACAPPARSRPSDPQDAVADADLVDQRRHGRLGARRRAIRRAPRSARAQSSSTSTRSRRERSALPSTLIEAAGGRYVEAAVMAAVPPHGHHACRCCSAARTREAAAELLAAARLQREHLFRHDRRRLRGEDVPQRRHQGPGGAADRIAGHRSPLWRRGRRACLARGDVSERGLGDGSPPT